MHLFLLPGVFRPHRDSWELAESSAMMVTPGDEVLDLCSGSGVVALHAAQAGAARVVAVDTSRMALLTIRLNAIARRLPVTVRRGDLFAPVAGRRFDLITANPPYLPSLEAADGEEPPRAARPNAVDGGPDGRTVLDRVITEAPRHLKEGGRLLVTHSAVCGVDRTEDVMRRAGLSSAVVRVHRGPPGPLLSARAEGLRARGIPVDAVEELVVVCGTLEFASSVVG